MPVPRALVEQHYSSRLFPVLQHWATDLSNSVGVRAVRPVARRRCDLVGRCDPDRYREPPLVPAGIPADLLRTITAAAVAYLVFAAMWGLNYRRLPLTARIKFDERAITPAASQDLARQAADEVNALYVGAHAELELTGGGTGRGLESGFAAVQEALQIERPALPAHPKRTLLDPYFARPALKG